MKTLLDPTVLFPIIVTMMYAGTALAHAYHGRYAWMVVWGGYALANIGMVILAIKVTK